MVRVTPFFISFRVFLFVRPLGVAAKLATICADCVGMKDSRAKTVRPISSEVLARLSTLIEESNATVETGAASNVIFLHCFFPP